MDEYEDERIAAWGQVARHPFFAECYGTEAPLIESMLKLLDAQTTEPMKAETTHAEEPVEWRILRAFANGFTEGLQRGANGRLDH